MKQELFSCKNWRTKQKIINEEIIVQTWEGDITMIEWIIEKAWLLQNLMDINIILKFTDNKTCISKIRCIRK